MARGWKLLTRNDRQQDDNRGTEKVKTSTTGRRSPECGRSTSTPSTTPTSVRKPSSSSTTKWHRKTSPHHCHPRPMADLIRNLAAKYPGKILMIDFWGMSCGPCRGAIQESKELRAEIAKRDDVKLIFIAGERTTEGSDAYKKYVAEWLANEETVCLTNADFTRLQELFQFNSIPHYETITPDCRRVRDDLRINGYDNFDYELERLKEKLK